jgi:Mn2+/Fe2+ NRAMP family transporter
MSRVGRFSQLGPGLITGAADDDPSGIATYSQAGAQFGYAMLWTVVFTLPLMAAIQLISARIGYVTRRGLAWNIKASFPRPVVLLIVSMLLIANGLNVAADIAAMAQALKLLIGGPAHLYAVGFGAMCMGLQIKLTYEMLARCLGVTVRSIDRAMTEWTKEGWIAKNRGYYTFHNIEKLEEKADPERIALFSKLGLLPRRSGG